MSKYTLSHDEMDDYLRETAKEMRDFKYLSRKAVSFASNILYIEQLGNPDYRVYKLRFVYKSSNDEVNEIANITVTSARSKSYDGFTVMSLTANCVIDPECYSKPITKTQIHVAKFMRALLEQRFSCTFERVNDFSNVIQDKTRTLNKLRFEELERIYKRCPRKLNLYTNNSIYGTYRHN